MLTLKTTHDIIVTSNEEYKLGGINMNLIDRFLRAKAHKYTEDTMTSYRTDLEQFFDFLEKRHNETNQNALIKKADYSECLDYLFHLQDRNLSVFTINRKLESITSLFKFCVDLNLIEENHMKKVDRNPTKHLTQDNDFLTKDEYDKLLSAIQVKQVGQPNFEFTMRRDLTLFSMIITLGLRITEARTLTFEQIDFTTGRIRLVRKGLKAQTIKLTDHLMNLLDEYLKERESLYISGGLENRIFLTVNGNELTTRDCNRALERYCKRAGIKRISNHDLRHTCATRLASQGATINDIKELLGHKQLATTSRYVHGASSNIEDLMGL